MKIYDQYETEPNPAYLGGLRSRVFVDRTTLFETGSFGRNVIGDSASKTFISQSLIGNKILFSEFPYLKKKEYPLKKGFSRFSVCVDTAEQFHDSVIGHPIEYTHVNKTTASILSPQGVGFDDQDVYNLLKVDFLPHSSSCELIIGTSTSSIKLNPTGSEQFCDSIWNYTGPYQSRYKGVFRLKSPTYKTVTPKFAEYRRNGNALQRMTSSVEINAINKLSYTVGTSTYSIGSSGSVINTMPASTIHCDIAQSIGLLSGNLILNGISSTSGYSWFYLTTNVLYKSFFGFGDGPHNFPTDIDLFEDFYPVIISFAPQIRGWKYGLYDAFPRYSKAVYRHGHYGQFRDMIEQRPYTKFYKNSTALGSAVQVRFVSSSIAFQYAKDYVTASNPHYDPRDTGFYDYEYRCGAPFLDAEPVD